MKLISVTHLSEEIINFIKNNNIEYIDLYKKEVTKEDVENTEIIIGNIRKDVLMYAKKLKYLQLDSAGNDTYLDVDLPKDCIMCNASGTFGELISEHLLMVTFMLFRNMPYYIQNQQDHKYKRIHHVKSIQNARFLILGTGDLGSKFAAKLKKLGAYTIGVKRTYAKKLPYFDEVYTVDKLDGLIGKCDVLCLCLPKSKDTNLLIDKSRLKMLSNDSFVINVGRSNAIDTKALCELLNQQKIKGAALDVFDQEPIPMEDEIWNTRNLIITPHVSGTFANEITYDLFYEIVYDNLKRYLNHDNLRNIVDKNIGY